MKKILTLLFTLLLLVGCGQKTNEVPEIENKDNENVANVETEEKKEIDLSQCQTLILTINPEIKLYFDDSNKVVAYDFLNDDADAAWGELSIVDADVKDAVLTLITTAEEKGYLSEKNSDISITLDETNEELSNELNTIITTYIDESELSLEASLTEAGETITISNVDKFVPGIYVSSNNPVIWCPDSPTYPAQIAIVFGEDNIGYIQFYNGDPGYTKYSDVFEWTEDGKITFKFGSESYNLNCSYEYSNGILTVKFPKEVQFVLNNNYSAPYGYRASGYESGFYGAERWSTYYEATYEDFMTDYNGINNNLLNLY